MVYFEKTAPVDAHLKTFDAPIREPNETVTQTHQHFMVVAAAILTDQSNTDTDNRYNEFVNQWISIIPNPEKQRQLREKRKQLLEERLKGETNNNTIGKKTKEVSIEITGDISSEIDAHRGRESMNRISAIVPDPIMRRWMAKQNPEMFLEHVADIQVEYEKHREKRLADKKAKEAEKPETAEHPDTPKTEVVL